MLVRAELLLVKLGDADVCCLVMQVLLLGEAEAGLQVLLLDGAGTAAGEAGAGLQLVVLPHRCLVVSAKRCNGVTREILRRLSEVSP